MPRNRFLLATALFATLYLLAWRPVRVWVTNDLVRPAFERLVDDDSPLRFAQGRRPGLYAIRTDIQGTWERNVDPDRSKRAQSLGGKARKNLYVFNGFGNAFFLLGGLYFLAFGHGWRPVGWLFLLHQAITALSLGCLLLAVSAHPAWLYPMNLLVTYITPAATGLFVLKAGVGLRVVKGGNVSHPPSQKLTDPHHPALREDGLSGVLGDQRAEEDQAFGKDHGL